MSIVLASKQDAIPGGAFAGKVFFLQNLSNGASVSVSGPGERLLASSSATPEQCYFQLLLLPSGEMQLFSNYAKSFVSGVNEGTPQEPRGQVLMAHVGDERWSRFWLSWDASDVSFTLQSSFSQYYVAVVNNGNLRLQKPEKPTKPADTAYFFRPVTISGVTIVDPAEFIPERSES